MTREPKERRYAWEMRYPSERLAKRFYAYLILEGFEPDKLEIDRDVIRLRF